MASVGRNEPCPCGSGKKAKRCCYRFGASEPRGSGTLPAPAPAARTTIDAAQAHFAQAQASWTQGDLGRAADHLQRGLALQPQFAEAHNNLGLVLHALGRRDAAVDSLRRAIALKPDYGWAHSNLGNLLQAQRKFDEAIASYRAALRFEPGHVQARVNLGNVQRIRQDLDGAIASFREALAVRPDFAIAHMGLAEALQARGDLDGAITGFRRALALQPDLFDAHSGLLFAMSFHPGFAPAARLAEARRYGAAVAARARPFANWPAATAIGQGRPLRVGLISGDLRSHPVGYFVESVITHLDPTRVELLAYPTLPQEDEVTVRIKPRFAAWHSVVDLGDEAAAARIRADGIQVLVDLAGHTAYNRLPVLAWKPAPVQASWLGFFGTTGVPGIDYLIADRVSVPESAREQFTESVWYLPDARFCFTPPAEAPAVVPAPASGNGCVTFGSFQGVVKLTDAVLAAWAAILRAMPTARLRLQNAQMDFPDARARLLERLRGAGIEPVRVRTVGQLPRDEYLRAHAEVDIVLDTFPYGGATTTCEALWMGVPTLTLAADFFAARQGASLNASVGLDDWIARDVDDYVARAVAHATDVEGLARLRASLRERMRASPLCDAPRFARALEGALLGMWNARQH
jgi:predicted O-linked N-acetylglucosamine transferase (SPINDLY family)